jgi:YD repeat-containing protein
LYESSYGCCGYDTQTDEQGITTTYTYDAPGRSRTEERLGITTTHFYDPAGRETETRRQSSGGTLTTKRSYDGAPACPRARMKPAW